MVSQNTPFRKTLSFPINSTSSLDTNIHEKKILFKVALTSVYLAKNVFKYQKQH